MESHEHKNTKFIRFAEIMQLKISSFQVKVFECPFQVIFSGEFLLRFFFSKNKIFFLNVQNIKLVVVTLSVCIKTLMLYLYACCVDAISLAGEITREDFSYILCFLR